MRHLAWALLEKEMPELRSVLFPTFTSTGNCFFIQTTDQKKADKDRRNDRTRVSQGEKAGSEDRSAEKPAA